MFFAFCAKDFCILYVNSQLQRKTLRDLEQKRDAIERFIESIELPRIRLYYIEGKSWQQCANTIQGNVTADGLRMELKRFFEKI